MLHKRNASQLLCLLSACLMVGGCGGAKVIKEKDQQPMALQAPLALLEDADIKLALDWVVVRNSPGSWVKNADWDEYRLRVINQSPEPVEIVDATLFDSLGTPLVPLSTRKYLVKASKESVKRYKNGGLEVRAGWSEGTILVAGAASAAAGTSLGLAALAGGGTSMAGAAIGALVLAPVMMAGGVIRGVNNGKVSREIEARHATLPLLVEAQQVQSLNLFYPLAPSPLRLELKLALGDGRHQTMLIDTSEILKGLHLQAGPEPDMAE